jgi:lysyl-tRNA synthetase class 2
MEESCRFFKILITIKNKIKRWCKMSEIQNQGDLRQVRLDKFNELKRVGRNPFEISKFDVTSNSEEIKSNFEEMEGKTVSLAGRIMSKRGQGKVGFYDVQDTYGRIQIFAKQDTLGEEEYNYLKTNDIGDIIGVTGEVFRTKMGEISVRAESVVLLTKSLQTLPEKFHGLKDTEIRYRQRYVDLIVNPEIKEVFKKRNLIIKGIREYLDNHGYMEVDTPVLSAIAGGANARPFVTHHNTLDIDMYMRIANELYLKRLVVGGLADGVYEMGKMFRNEGMDSTHNPEYTAIELYKAYADYNDMMELTENIIAYVSEKVNGTTKINFNGTDLDLTPPWRRIRMQDAVKEYTGIDFDLINTDEEAIAIAKTKKIEIKPLMTRGHVINALFEEYCEEHIVQPTFVTHHPVEISPLAKKNVADPRLTDRFEAFINTKEIANAFSELNDPIDQRERFEDQLKHKEAGDDEAHMMDYDFLNAIEVGMPPTGGLGIGVDRVIMFLTNQVSIRDIILFPTMKPID